MILEDWTSLLTADAVALLAAGGAAGAVFAMLLARSKSAQVPASGFAEAAAHSESPEDEPARPGKAERVTRAELCDRLDIMLADRRDSHNQPTVLILNIDNFRLVNDGLGHSIGDQLLLEAYDRLCEELRENDTVAPIGGDEFVILLEGSQGAEEAGAVADRVLRALSVPFALSDRGFHLTASIGLARSPDHGDSSTDLLRAATTAMKIAKSRGGNSVETAAGIVENNAADRLTLETDLRRALANEEFELHYQPKFAAQSGRLIGGEALLRWSHPEKGMVPPGAFIPAAEDSGLIVPIGDWVVGEALAACARFSELWSGPHKAPTVSINLSFKQFERPGFFEWVQEMIRRSGCDSRSVDLELTESIVMQNANLTIDTLRRLRALGVSLSIDDFGTGYSSLSLLKRLPVQILKIDRSFIRDLPDSSEDGAICKTVISLAHSLGLEVVAEGVETDEQLQFLRDHGCDQIQGFLLGRPMPEADFVQLLTSQASGAPGRARAASASV